MKKRLVKTAYLQGLTLAEEVIEENKVVIFNTENNSQYKMQRMRGKVYICRKPVESACFHDWHEITYISQIKEGCKVQVIGPDYSRTTGKVTKIW